MRLDVRKLTIADLAEFKRLRLDALQTNPESFGSHYAREAAFDDEEFANRLRVDDDNFIWGGFEGGLLVAMAGFYVVENVGNIWGVFTAPDHRGRGISKQLIMQIIADAKVNPSLVKIQLGVTSDSEAALGLYKAVGFETYSIEADAIQHGEFSMCEILMELSV
ncbi:MAG: GNAT family N-acetyltransferase [Alphaproteobacteria bacterium]|nr:GNAT family N-acetyltransferase [Alphaproteobacteria bacterium]